MLLALLITNVTAETLCLPSEKIIFNCEISNKHKFASVCASPDLTNSKGYLQYRFGNPKKLELVYPNNKENSQNLFYFRLLHPYQSFVKELTFKSGAYFYTIAIYEVSEELNDIPDGAYFGQIEIEKQQNSQYRGRSATHIIKCNDYSESGMEDLMNVVQDADKLIEESRQ
jgi:hypothetical protein